MNEILVKLYVPIIDGSYDILIPANKRIYTIIGMLVKSIRELTKGYYNPKKNPQLYDKISAKAYDINLLVAESDIRNGTELILI